MITTKQRAFLRALANALEPLFQVGKEGLGEESIIAISNLLNARELIKIKVLKNCDDCPKDIMQKLQEQLQCEAVQVIGQMVVVYKKSTKKNFKHIEIIS